MALHQSLAAAREVCGADELVVRLAPLPRWLVVSEDDWWKFGAVCGWVLEPEAPLTTSELIAAALWRLTDMGFGALLREGA